MTGQEIDHLKTIVWEAAKSASERGPGWAQEGVVLRAIADRVSGGYGLRPDLATQRAILDAWHDLFTQRRLSWGYDLDNPGSPFFHVR